LLFKAYLNLSAGILEEVKKLATCPWAWTPLSVLPAPIKFTFSPVTIKIAFSISS